MARTITEEQVKCYHCGDNCGEDKIILQQKPFCCEGCKLVYEILQENDLCTYYDLDKNPGIKLKAASSEKFSYLDNAAVQGQLLQFKDDRLSKVTFQIPHIHCASCIWLLENLFKLRDGISTSLVNFVRKEVTITFEHKLISLKQVVELLASIGYEPHINLDGKPEGSNKQQKLFYLRLGVAGFCFGNIMLLSFPEYLAHGSFIGENYTRFFGWLNILLALPVFFFSSTIFFKSAWESLKQKQLNIDVPIVIGILVLFGRTLFEVFTETGAGYADSLAGLVFFLLIGRYFQGRTYEMLSFDRKYTSYFPVAVTKIQAGQEVQVTLDKLEPNDRILVRNEELIPADAILLKGDGNINYSFVTGEAEPVTKEKGQVIFAGGRQEGSTIELQLVKRVSQSYLTDLWNHQAFGKEREDITSVSNKISHYFTPAFVALAVGVFIFWSFTDINKALNAATSVLIVACPCVLAISSPFILGNAMRILGHNKLYLKDTSVVERLSTIDTLVFDKTGTITRTGSKQIIYSGGVMDERDQSLLKSLVKHSTHPLSRQLSLYLQGKETYEVDQYKEQPGLGIRGIVDGIKIKAGSAAFLGLPTDIGTGNLETRVWVSFNGVLKGYFSFHNLYRPHLKEVIASVKEDYSLSLLSGDNQGEYSKLLQYFGANVPMYFRQSPHEKLAYIEQLQKGGSKVLMLGDGLNDAGALRQSDAGISMSEDINNFSPACDAILHSSEFDKLPAFLAFCKDIRVAMFLGLAVSGSYNIIGTYFAVQGELSPVIAAIIMPLSSLSVILYGLLSTYLLGLKHNLLRAEKPDEKEENVTIYEMKLT